MQPSTDVLHTNSHLSNMQKAAQQRLQRTVAAPLGNGAVCQKCTTIEKESRQSRRCR
jgi:hypothetical protein